MKKLNVLSCFDGIASGKVALERCGVPVGSYFSSEIDKSAKKIAEKNHQDIISIGDVTKVSYENGVLHTENGDFETEIDLVMAGSPCFGAGTLVYTTEGYKNIEDIIEGDEVLTHKNRFRKVLRTGWKWTDVGVLKNQNAIDTVVTKNHPYYIRHIDDKTISNPEWINIGDAKSNDYVCQNIINIEEDVEDENRLAFGSTAQKHCRNLGRFIYMVRADHNFDSDPSYFLNFSKDLTKEILKGCFGKDKEFLTASKKLALYMQAMIAKAYNKNANIDYRDGVYFIRFNKRQRDVVINGQLLIPFQKYEDLGKKDKVYNLEVEEDNSYTANNLVVHNCQGFSIAGKKLNFEDPRSKLFFEFVRLIKEINPKYFFLENVKMKKEWSDIISDNLGVQPISINSNLLSAQNRKRMYWTNIPNASIPDDKEIFLKDIVHEFNDDDVDLEPYKVPFDKTLQILDKEVYEGKIGYFRKDSQANRVYDIHGKAVTLCGEAGGGAAKMGQYLFGCITPDRVNKRQQGQRFNEGDKFYTLTAQDKHGVLVDGYIRKLTPIECERLQTLSDNYTECDGVSDTQRYKCLGNGWTVDIISHLMKGIKEEED